MFVQSGNGSALTRSNKQAAAREKKKGFVSQEPAGRYLQSWLGWTGKVSYGCDGHRGITVLVSGMETKAELSRGIQDER